MVQVSEKNKLNRFLPDSIFQLTFSMDVKKQMILWILWVCIVETKYHFILTQQLADNCDNVSIASNSDVWKGSDSEDDNFESKENPAENEGANRENEKESDKTVSINDKQSDVATDGTIAEKETSNEDKNKVVENNTKIDDAETKQGVEGNSKVDDATTKQSAEDSSIIESEEQIEAEQPEKASDEVVDKETTEGVHEAENKEKDISETENKEKESESNDKVENNTDNVDNSVNEQEKPADVAATVEALVSSVAESVPTSPKEAAEEITTDKDSVNEVAADKEPVVNGDKDPPTEEPNKDTAEDGPPNRYTSEQDDGIHISLCRNNNKCVSFKNVKWIMMLRMMMILIHHYFVQKCQWLWMIIQQ